MTSLGLNEEKEQFEETKPRKKFKMVDAFVSIAKKNEEFKANMKKPSFQAMKVQNAPNVATELDDMVDMHIDQAHPNPEFAEALEQRQFTYIDAC